LADGDEEWEEECWTSPHMPCQEAGRLLRRFQAQAFCIHVFILLRPKIPPGKISLSSLWASASQLLVALTAVHWSAFSVVSRVASKSGQKQDHPA